MVEAVLEYVVTLLRERGAPFRQVFHLRIIIDIEMFRLQDVPIEAGVLDLVLTEVKKLSRNRRGPEHQENATDMETKTKHEMYFR